MREDLFEFLATQEEWRAAQDAGASSYKPR